MAVVPLTTLERVKTYGKIAADVRNGTDDTLTAMILSVSQKMEQYCSRVFGIATVTEAGILTCDEFPAFQMPIASITSVRYAASGRRADLVALPATQYEISPCKNNIRVYEVIYGGMVEATFSGGLVADTAAVIADHPALEDACKMQVISLWQRHDAPDRAGTTIGTGETTWTADYSLLKSVKADLDQNYNNQHRIF